MSQIPPQTGPYYYDYSASTSTFRPAKRPRPLTEDEAAAITRNFQRGDFFVGSSGVSSIVFQNYFHPVRFSWYQISPSALIPVSRCDLLLVKVIMSTLLFLKRCDR